MNVETPNRPQMAFPILEGKEKGKSELGRRTNGVSKVLLALDSILMALNHLKVIVNHCIHHFVEKSFVFVELSLF